MCNTRNCVKIKARLCGDRPTTYTDLFLIGWLVFNRLQPGVPNITAVPYAFDRTSTLGEVWQFPEISSEFFSCFSLELYLFAYQFLISLS